MKYGIKWIANNAILSFEGDITFDDLDQANNEIYGDPRLDLMKYTIFDFRGAESIDINYDEMKVISTLDKGISKWNRNLKIAIIVDDNNSNNKEKVLNYIQLMEDNDWKIGYFIELEKAVEWCLE